VSEKCRITPLVMSRPGSKALSHIKPGPARAVTMACEGWGPGFSCLKALRPWLKPRLSHGRWRWRTFWIYLIRSVIAHQLFPGTDKVIGDNIVIHDPGDNRAINCRGLNVAVSETIFELCLPYALRTPVALSLPLLVLTITPALRRFRQQPCVP